MYFIEIVNSKEKNFANSSCPRCFINAAIVSHGTKVSAFFQVSLWDSLDTDFIVYQLSKATAKAPITF